MRFAQVSSVVVSFCASVLALPQAGNGPPTVTIDSGPVQGVATSIPGAPHNVTKYLGVPFAAKPLRFAPPASPKAWKTPFKATKYGPACIQQFDYPAHNITISWFDTPPPAAGESEDCLNVNVYAPAAGKNKTVMVWFYGGSLTFGANSLTTYDGSYFAAFEDVVIVTVNYRTNVFGFPGSPQLPVRANNLGFLDQRFALNWVQRNIAAFGGDPAKVTIFGESAGALSVDILVTSYPTKAPFRAAIEESGQGSYRFPVTNPYASWNTLAAAVGCNDTATTLKCMRGVPAMTLKNTSEHLALAFNFKTDNYTFIANRTAARLAGKIAKVPVLAGTNANEGTLFTYGATNLSDYLTTTLPTAPSSYLDQIANAYPIGSPGIANSSQQISQIYTELIFQCSQARQLKDNKAAGIPTWRYFYNASFPQIQLFPGSDVFHSSELQLVWGSYRAYPKQKQTPFEQKLSTYMMGAWANFAKNPMQGPGWPQVPSVGNLGANGVVNATIQSSVVDARCALYDPIYDVIE
ncbi:hypothetical protein H2200_010447 [Cladophialophora chaetospira]|uniref:Carboxylic ester hydrolase n=1 Tax=Cladophialophora chaetospira TaxID=386627 RepID=A0AA38X1N0_9EURO|nr:hypothetical protein H2200_010447 [Cladophialophora chaetospira]